MSRPLRFVPGQQTLVEVTTRTLQSRFLLRPSSALNEIVVGALARAQRLYPVQICAYTFLSNHYHLLLVVDTAQQLAGFMGYFNSNLAREVGRLAEWREKIWSRRYQAIVVSGEPEAQRDRLKYVLGHGAKEGLVEHPSDWPGVHAIRPLLAEETVEGYWFDRTQEYAARRRGEEFERLRFATHETLVLSPLLCWRHLSPEKRKERLAEVVREIEEEAAARLERTGTSPLGVVAIQNQSRTDRPMRTKKSPAPLFHAATRHVRKDLRAAYHGFVAAFRDAAEELRAGNLGAAFPAGSFPPALPFVSG